MTMAETSSPPYMVGDPGREGLGEQGGGARGADLGGAPGVREAGASAVVGSEDTGGRRGKL